MTLFPDSPYAGERRIIDVSGDGANNAGRPAQSARDDAVNAGVTINGLPILTVEPDLEEHYQDNVIGGGRVLRGRGQDRRGFRLGHSQKIDRRDRDERALSEAKAAEIGRCGRIAAPSAAFRDRIWP